MEPVELTPMVVTASRSAQEPGSNPYAVDFVPGTSLQSPRVQMVDDALRQSPAFSLFRRSSSLTANPTAQGVSLRGVGPSGASRSLVLWDGIPLNDPFGGWVAWAKVPTLTLAGAEILPGGGAGVWGSAALSGVVQFLSNDPLAASPANQDRVTLDLGNHGTWRGEFLAVPAATEDSTFHVGGRWFSTDGFYQYRAGQRGPVDRPLDSEHRLLHGTFAHQWSGENRIEIGARWFDEQRGNGTPLRHNESRESAAHARWSTTISPDVSLEVLAYVQDQTFAATFSAVNDAHDSESPVLDQFDVPATAYGFAAVTSWHHRTDRKGATTTAGLDLRAVRGETREAYFYNADEARFLRNRFAGGRQFLGGVFATHQRWLTESVSLQASGRIDQLQNRNGHRRDINVDTGANTVLESYPDRTNTEFTPALGLAWEVSPQVRVRTAIRRAFRLPTLNEYYRPFRVGDVTTNANPDLAIESLDGIDGAIEYHQGPWTLSVGAFANRLSDAVANVTLATTPSGVTRQRLNLDRISVQGAEAQVTWQPALGVTLTLAHLYTDAEVAAAGVAPGLVGRQLPQVPRHITTAQVQWRFLDQWRLEAAARAASRQYEDDANLLPLAPATTIDAALVWMINPRLALRLAGENLFDSRIETGRSDDGFVTIAPSRLVRFGADMSW